MQDRQPGAPGQYKATLSAAEFQKMQAGEQFTITMVRDDQPIVEGTPYSKAAVLPDELAAIICPDVLNPSPADALRALLPKNGKVPMTANLPMGGHRVTGLGAPVADGDAVPLGYAKKVGAHHNLLDNSDFRNPVNQRGYTKWTPDPEPETGADPNTQYGFQGGYNIDRWFSPTANTVTVNADNINVSGHFFVQRVEAKKLASGKYTIGFMLKTGLCMGVVDISGAAIGSSFTVYSDGSIGVYLYRESESVWQVYILCGIAIDLLYAFMYEGEYTAETLPEYQPKGYGAELAECQRYYQIRSANNISAVDMRPLMRLTNPTITAVSDGYSYSADL